MKVGELSVFVEREREVLLDDDDPRRADDRRLCAWSGCRPGPSISKLNTS